jgi:hydroxypyruvate isomerase
VNIRQSFSWWCFENRGVNPTTLLNESKKIGYMGVDLLPREFWEEAINVGLTIVNIAGHRPLEKGFNHLENHDYLEKEVLKQLELSAKFKIPYVTVFSGNRNGINDEIGLSNTVIGLKRIITQAEKLGVTLVLELLNSKIDHPDHQCDRTLWGVAVCEIINSPNLKLLYDIYHMQIMEGDVIHTIIDHLDRIAHIHTAGVPGRNDIDGTQELNYTAIVKAIV